MAENTSSRPTARNADVWVDHAWALLCHSYRAVIEIGHGVRANTIPWITCCGFGAVASAAITLRLDRLGWKLSHLIRLYPVRPFFYWTYCGLAVTGAFWLWAANQVRLRVLLLKSLKEALTDSGLKTTTGRIPAFISNIPLDLHTHKLRLRNVGIPKAQFEKSREPLGTKLQIFIDDIRENRAAGTIDLLYSHVGMPDSSVLHDVRGFAGFQFVVGDTRSGSIVERLRDVPHLLIAGQSGSGKSTFLRHLLTILYANNPHCQFTGIDLKGGLEFQIFEDLSRMKVCPDVKSAVKALEKFATALESRMALLKANRCKDLDAYFALPGEKRKSTPEFNSTDLDRHIVVVDEAAEMFLAGDHASPKEIQKARAALSKIARQGRAVGIHLVIATQRPDKRSLDTQVKSNLIGVLCFAMQDDPSSIIVLGNGRATDLPGDIKGRAIWKRNAEMVEVQTPILSAEDATKILDEIRAGEKKGKAVTVGHAVSEATATAATPTAVTESPTPAAATPAADTSSADTQP